MMIYEILQFVGVLVIIIGLDSLSCFDTFGRRKGGESLNKIEHHHHLGFFFYYLFIFYISRKVCGRFCNVCPPLPPLFFPSLPFDRGRGKVCL